MRTRLRVLSTLTLDQPRRRGEAGRTRTAPDGDGAIERSFAATAEAPVLARRAAAPALADWKPTGRDAALLVISELVTNAVRHGSAGPQDRVTLRVEPHGARLRIEVGDTGAAGTAPSTTRAAGARASSGWGLPIVAELSDRWGVEHVTARTRVWCELSDAAER